MLGYSRFSHHAQRAMTHARLLVGQFRHPRMDTGHLLVGVMLTRGSIGSRVLAELELDPQVASVYLKSMTLPLDEPIESPPNDAALDICLDLAGDESKWLGHHYVGTEHLLLGITRTNVGNASDLLNYLGVASDLVRRRVKNALNAGAQEYNLELARHDARLSELSRRVINAAEQTAVSMDHEMVGVGHLLYVLARESRSVTSVLLEAAELDLRRLETILSDTNHPAMVYALTSLERILPLASEYAQDAGSHYTGTEHLLIALTIDEAGHALLDSLEVSPSVVRRKVESKLRVGR